MHALARIAAAKGVTPSQLVLAWTIAQGAIPFPVTRRVISQANPVAAAAVTLTEAELIELDQAAPVGAAAGDRYPEGQMETLAR